MVFIGQIGHALRMKVADVLGVTVLPLLAIFSLVHFVDVARGDISRLLLPYNAKGYQLIVVVFAIVGAIQGSQRKAFLTNFIPWLSVGIVLYVWLVLINGL
jgi:hypothetical protein